MKFSFIVASMLEMSYNLKLFHKSITLKLFVGTSIGFVVVVA